MFLVFRRCYPYLFVFLLCTPNPSVRGRECAATENYLVVQRAVGEERRGLGIALGHVPWRRRPGDSLVQHHQLAGDGALLIGCVEAKGESSARVFDTSCCSDAKYRSPTPPGILAFIMIRTLRRDIAKYNEEDKVSCVGLPGRRLATHCSSHYLRFFSPTGGSHGADRLEAGPRRCFPPASPFLLVGLMHGMRSSLSTPSSPLLTSFRFRL